MTHLEIDCFFYACLAVGYAFVLCCGLNGAKHYEQYDDEE